MGITKVVEEAWKDVSGTGAPDGKASFTGSARSG